MRILVAGDDDETRRQLAVTLQGAGHAVRTAQDERGALAALQQESPHLVLLTAARTGNGSLTLVRQLRDNPRAKASQLILVARDVPEAFSIEAYAAGLDGDIRLPHSPEYLVARINALQRRLEPKAKPAPERAEVAKPAAVELGDGPLALVARAPAWRTAAQHLKGAASKFLTLEASVGDVPPADYEMSLACGIMLLNVQHELELRIAVGTSMASGKRLAVHLFGPEGEDLVADMMGEIGNIFMGAMKTALGHDSLAFTGGLPEALATDLVLRPALTYKLQEAFSLTLVDAKLVVHLGLRSKANLDLPAASLKEGMVLAKDVFNSKGLMMINAGTRLSSHMIEKLKSVLTTKQLVQVMAG
jgi:DNA-binding response OmpR family regulator